MKKPVSIAKDLAKKYNVCFNVISSAPGQMEEQIVKAVASVNACSRVFAFDDVIDKPEYNAGALFVIDERVVEDAIEIEKVIGAKLGNILFDYNSVEIRPEYTQGLDALGMYMRNNPQTYAVFSGFTDSLGNQEYNLALSQLRAEAVGLYLVAKFNLDPGRIALLWYGEAGPVADNDTKEGRMLNRRVSVIVTQ
jgi:OOP family OmpA-OmpF porin